jgi:sec-independent protein translocase protein TatC
MRKRVQKLPAKQRPAKASHANREKLPLIEHIHELKRRLLYVAACIAVGSATAYGLEHQIVDILLRPSNGQHFIYTSPLGGMNFLFGVCLDIGLVLATPIIIYQLLAFIKPLMQGTTRAFLLLASTSAFVVAMAGVIFGYYIGLPSALHFLLHQFTTIQVKPLLTIQSYMSFVVLYLFGSALMFQLPLILFIINRIKPLKPSKLLKYERHLIVFAFIAAFIMNPTPNIVDQMIIVVPIILMYQVGIGLIWMVNRNHGIPVYVQLLREQDLQRQAERASRQLSPLVVPEPVYVPTAAAEPSNESTTIEPVAASTATSRPKQYATDFAASPRSNYLPLRGQLVQ